jgi:hypothetical protein
VGEPVFSEFLADLQHEAGKELAVDLYDLADQLGEVEATLNGALKYLEDQKKHREEQKQLAELRRISQQNAGPEATKEPFEMFVKNNQAADLRRLGPVRRFKSGS